MTSVDVIVDSTRVHASPEWADVTVVQDYTRVIAEQAVTNLNAEGASEFQIRLSSSEVVVVEVPGLQGPPGNGSATGHAVATDYSDLRYWFLGYAGNLIKRLDNALAPPLVQQATGDWADRLTLTYT